MPQSSMMPSWITDKNIGDDVGTSVSLGVGVYFCVTWKKYEVSVHTSTSNFFAPGRGYVNVLLSTTVILN